MAKRRRRTKTKRTRMAKSRKMARCRTKKLRKKNKRGGSLNLSEGRVAEEYRLMEEAIDAARVAKQKQQPPLSVSRSSRSILKRKMVPADKKKQQPQMSLEDIGGFLEEIEGVKEDSPQERKTPVMLSFSPYSNFTRYDRKKDLCGIHTEKDPCDEQYGCYWDEDKCLPSSGKMTTGEPTKGEPSSKQYLTDEEKKINEKLQLLNKILLASFGFDEGGNKTEERLVLKNATELSKLVDKAKAEELIQMIDDKASDMETMIANKKKYVFPNTGGMGGPAGSIKKKMDTLKITLKRGVTDGIITDGIITDKETDDEEDGF